MGLLRRTPSGERRGPRIEILRQNMEGFSLSMSSDSFNEEWMDLQDIVTKDLEKDLEEKNLGDLDFVGLYSIGTGHKGFERQPSYFEIFSEIESKDPMGTFNESTMFFNNYNNNISAKENNVVVVKQERTSSLTGYTHYSPSSPSDSWISTEGFPAELDELNEQYEIQLVEKIQVPGEQVDATVAYKESEEEKEEQSDDSDEDYVPEYTKPAKRKRASQTLRKDAEKDDLSSDSDPDFDPEEFEEVVRPSKRRRKQKEKTSDYESEEFSEEEKPQRNPAPRRYRRPSKNPVPQQRKKGSTLKISQWIVKLLRDPETNPSAIRWEDEPAGKFRVINSNALG